MKILEKRAIDILSNYVGANNQILLWKSKLDSGKSLTLTRTQSDYIIKYHEVVPKVARKYIDIFEGYGELISEQRRLLFIPKKIWVEKLLCETDKAFQIWGKILDNDPLSAIWIPKSAILYEEKKLNREIDYSKYDKIRPVLPHQKPAIEKLLVYDRFILADEMGLAKTSTTIIASLEGDFKKVLIICPASLKINWKREIEMYTNKKIKILEGDKWGSSFDYYIINYDILRNYHSLEKKDEMNNILVKENFDLVIIDESHYISNKSALRTKLLNDIVKDIPKRWLLTGTPITSRPMNFYNLLQLVDHPLTLNWEGYVKRYCKGFRMMVNGKKIWRTNGASNLDELRERTKNVVIRRLKSDVLDLPEKIIEPLYLELNNLKYNSDLDEFVKIAREEIGNESINITLNRLVKVRQTIALEKIPYTCELIDSFLDQDKKVIVFSNFTMPLDILEEKYPKISVRVDGKTDKLKRQKNVDSFQNDPKIKLFIGNIVAAGVGLTLTEAEGVIMNDLSFVPAHHDQAEDRAHRIGTKNSVLVYYPIFENTIEMIIFNILNKKRNIIDQIMGDGEYSDSFGKELIKELKKDIILGR